MLTHEQKKYKDLAMRALIQMRGDDAVRARIAFRGMVPSQMQEPHGESGMTRAEYLQRCVDADAEIDAALAWLREL